MSTRQWSNEFLKEHNIKKEIIGYKSNSYPEYVEGVKDGYFAWFLIPKDSYPRRISEYDPIEVLQHKYSYAKSKSQTTDFEEGVLYSINDYENSLTFLWDSSNNDLVLNLVKTKDIVSSSSIQNICKNSVLGMLLIWFLLDRLKDYLPEKSVRTKEIIDNPKWLLWFWYHKATRKLDEEVRVSNSEIADFLISLKGTIRSDVELEELLQRTKLNLYQRVSEKESDKIPFGITSVSHTVTEDRQYIRFEVCLLSQVEPSSFYKANKKNILTACQNEYNKKYKMLLAKEKERENKIIHTNARRDPLLPITCYALSTVCMQSRSIMIITLQIKSQLK